MVLRLVPQIRKLSCRTLLIFHQMLKRIVSRNQTCIKVQTRGLSRPKRTDSPQGTMQPKPRDSSSQAKRTLPISNSQRPSANLTLSRPYNSDSSTTTTQRQSILPTATDPKLPGPLMSNSLQRRPASQSAWMSTSNRSYPINFRKHLS
jgi:hypothetical protein